MSVPGTDLPRPQGRLYGLRVPSEKGQGSPNQPGGGASITMNRERPWLLLSVPVAYPLLLSSLLCPGLKSKDLGLDQGTYKQRCEVSHMTLAPYQNHFHLSMSMVLKMWLLDRQHPVPRLHSRPTDSQTLGVGAGKLHLKILSCSDANTCEVSEGLSSRPDSPGEVFKPPVPSTSPSPSTPSPSSPSSPSRPSSPTGQIH